MDGYAVLDGYPPTTQPLMVYGARRSLSDADMGDDVTDRGAERCVRVGPRLHPDAEPREVCWSRASSGSIRSTAFHRRPRRRALAARGDAKRTEGRDLPTRIRCHP